jgi:hypothetical protein
MQSGGGAEGYDFPGWPCDGDHPSSGTVWVDAGLSDVKDSGGSSISGTTSLTTGWRVAHTLDFGDGFAFTESGGNPSANAVSPDIEQVNGILVLANVYVEQLYSYAKGRLGAHEQAKLMAAIALSSSSGATYIAPVSIRYIDSETNTNNGRDVSVREADHYHIPHDTSSNPAQRQVHTLPRIHKDLPIRTYITQKDIVHLNPTSGPSTWKYVRLLLCIDNHSQTYREADYITYAEIGHTTLSVVMPHAQHLTDQKKYWFTDRT